MRDSSSLVAHHEQARWEHATWSQAATLAERVSSTRHPVIAASIPDATAIRSAERKLQRWKEMAPFNSGSYFAERLTMDGLIENDLLLLLAESSEALQERLHEPVDWLMALAQAFDGQYDTTQLAQLEEYQHPFVSTIRPLLQRAWSRLDEGIQELVQQHAELPFDPQKIGTLLFASLPGQLQLRLNRVLVLELNVARVQGRLQGTTPEERFQDFLRQLAQEDAMLDILEEYPVLARQLLLVLDRWVDYALEFLAHLCEDWQLIRAHFTPARDPGMLTEIEGDAGDTHRGGRSVMILKFQSGFRLVYKPRSLAIDTHFQQLLQWLNEHGHQPVFRSFQVLDRGDYGWTEFIHPAPCQSREEIERFYQRQGAYLALLYALAATDFHAGNIIAAGEHPVLIDLEALFHPARDSYDLKHPEYPAMESISHSVLHVGLLPQRIWFNENSEGIDLSGLGGQAGQLSPSPLPTWRNAGTDQMHLVRERREMPTGRNRPTLCGQEINVLEFSHCLTDGFVHMYRLLIQHRDAFLEELLPRFANDETRCVLRATKTYSLLLTESFHPDVLRNALDRDRLFDRLWVGVPQCPQLARIIPAERNDLLAGDIPLFTSHPASRDLLTSHGEVISAFFAESGLDGARKRLRQLGEQDLAKQSWIIQASFTSMTMGASDAITRSLHLQPSTSAASTASTGELVEGALAVGNRLAQLALFHEDAAGWIGVMPKTGRDWHLLPTDVGLYSGTSGIALFLAYLGLLTGETAYTSLAKSALSMLRRQVARQVEQPGYVSIGVFNGISAAIYLYSHLGTLWGDHSLFDEAGEIVTVLSHLIAKDEQFDMIGGAAGCIAALLSLQAVAPSQTTLAAALQCGNHLIAHAQPMSEGMGWKIKGELHPLAGFSHGAAGIALSLLRLAACTGEQRFSHIARAAIKYERSLFSRQERNWPDLRTSLPPQSPDASGAGRTSMVTWCHGAAGVGLGRLNALPYIDSDPVLYEEIDAALETTLAHGFGLNHSLCHGDFGNIEVLLTACQVLPRSQDRQQRLASLTAMLLRSIASQGWITGVPLGTETPGLMTGIAGTGYELLRLAYPQKVPSVLVLAPPPCEF